MDWRNVLLGVEGIFLSCFVLKTKKTLKTWEVIAP